MAEYTAATTVTDAACLYWLDQLAAVARLTEALRGIDPCASGRPAGADEVHDLRVAARRCQSVAGALAPWLPAGWPRQVRDALRPLRKACDRLRDLDVLLEWLLSQPSPQLASAGLVECLRRERSAAMAQVLARLGRPKIGRRIGRLTELLQNALDSRQTAAGPTMMRLADVTAAALLCRAAPLTAGREILTAPSADLDNLAEILHRQRIAGKDFRYTLEMLLPALTPEAQQLREKFCHFQDCLGALHDHYRFAALLSETAAEHHLPEALLPALDSALAAERLGLRDEFNNQLQTMTPAWFVRSVLAAVAD